MADGADIIDFSSNINPLGPPAGLKEVLIKSYDELISYPDIKYRELRENISAYLGCHSDEVMTGNGALEIINNVSLLFKRVVVFTPCFIEYIKRPEILGREVVRLRLDNDFKIDLGELNKALKEGDLLILGNPNNPTAKRIPEDMLYKIQSITKERNAFLLLDEAFYEFCPFDYDSIKLFHNAQNVCIIRAATKFFALPGIRLGYAYAKGDFVKRYNEIESPWSVNSFANAAARNIFKDVRYIENTREYIKKEREFLLTELSGIDYLKVFDSQVNFILIKLLKYDEDILFDKFLKNGILIRKASSFEGLDKSYIRIAVKDHDSNKRIVNCFKECV
ncbi:threonine-phosphate decarboxylase [Oxobacter pfennigii]|uniref:Threonine-phosphate decarboxylase n=2 Tax=Oxobacter pfennigii TaxID=36849 RepID=A0A0P8YDT3_9CLOT|nr:threonine-phosphate decarboxylase [Oxobacter pfennigii]